MKGRVWTPEEDRILRVLLKDCAGKSKILASLPGRTWAAITNRSYEVETPKDPLVEIRRASNELMEAMLDAQVKFANRGGLTLSQAQAVLMGGNYAKSNAAAFGTCSIQRLTNHIHAEAA